MEGGGASVAGCVLRNATRLIGKLFIPLLLLLSCSPVIPLSGCHSPIELLVRSPQALLSSEEFIRSDCLAFPVSWPGRQFAVHKAKDWLIVFWELDIGLPEWWLCHYLSLVVTPGTAIKIRSVRKMLFWLWYTNNCLWNSWQVELWPEPLFIKDIYFVDFYFTMVLYLPSLFWLAKRCRLVTWVTWLTWLDWKFHYCCILYGIA